MLALLAVVPLVNAGFEAAPVQSGWTTYVYGARPAIEADVTAAHGGRQSLRVTSTEPSDTALGQDVRLQPGRWYRFAGWVRTRCLEPRGAPAYGTLQVQREGGAGIIAAGANHGGDTDWTEVPVVFRAPPGGLVHLAVFFVGFGQGTGSAWFDDMRLEEIDVGRAPITVTREPLGSDPISPLQYGQFVEYLCGLVGSMWAEKLYDTSFEGLSGYGGWVFLKETDFKERPWVPCGAVNRVVFTLDREAPVGGTTCAKLAVAEGPPAQVGIAQDGIAVRRGTTCRLSLWLRQEGVAGAVRVRLHREGKTLAAAEFRPAGSWAKYRAQLAPTQTVTDATLSIEFRGPGTLWVDNASLMPDDSVGGWRRDVVEAVKALRPGVIRFGGSALEVPSMGDFEWRHTVGDPDRRPPLRAWGGLQPVGAGLEEFVQFCRLVGAEPLICVRFTGRTPRDAADEVEYFNGPASSPMGALRARNGHPESYRVRHWQVGNEVFGPDYDAGLAEFCRAMKAVDPAIQLFSAGPSPGLLRSAGPWLDFVCPHHYGCENLVGMQQDFDRIRAMIAGSAPGRDIRVAVTEWNTTAGDFGPTRAMLWTLSNALACSRYHNLMHRNADLVKIANRSNLIDSFCSGIIQADNHRLYKTPTYYAQQLYAALSGTRALRVRSETPVDAAPDISATLSEKGAALTLFAVNDSLEEVARTLDLSAFGAGGQELEVWTVSDRDGAGEPDVTNSFADPERVRAVRSRFHAAGPRFEYRFPGLSLTVLRWRVTGGRRSAPVDAGP